MTIPSIAHKITVGIDGETVYTREYVYQYDNASDFFEVTVSGVADLLIFAEQITVSYELMRDGQRICGTKEYTCEVLLESAAITKVICDIPADIRKNPGFWCGQIHIYEGERRRSTDVFVFKTLPGMRPSEQIEGKPSNAERYFGSIGFGLKARLMNATRQLAACDESFCIAEDLTAYADQSQLFTFDSDVILGNSDDAVVVNKGFGNFDGEIGFEATDPKPVSSGFGDFDGEIGFKATDPLPVTSEFGEIKDNIAFKDVSKGRYASSERLPPFHISARTDESYRAYTASAGDTSETDTSFGSSEESTAYTAQGQAAEYEESAPIKLEATATVVNPDPPPTYSEIYLVSFESTPHIDLVLTNNVLSDVDQNIATVDWGDGTTTTVTVYARTNYRTVGHTYSSTPVWTTPIKIQPLINYGSAEYTVSYGYWSPSLNIYGKTSISSVGDGEPSASTQTAVIVIRGNELTTGSFAGLYMSAFYIDVKHIYLSQSMFRYCSSLELIDIRYTGTGSIAGDSFSDCTALTHLIIRSVTPPTVRGSFSLPSGTNIYVPASAVNTYKTDAKWSEVAERIYAIT